MSKVSGKIKGLEKILKGINKASEIISSTLGPCGRLVLIDKNDGFSKPRFTKDGATVAKNLKQIGEDSLEKIGVSIATYASQQMGEKIGDGSTSVVKILNEMASLCYELILSRADPRKIKKALDIIEKKSMDIIDSMKQQIVGNEEIHQISTIAANNDKQIGNDLAELFIKLGANGMVVIEESRTGENHTEIKEGFYFEQGVASQSIFKEEERERRKIEMEEACILVVKGKVEPSIIYAKFLAGVLNAGRPLLIVAEDFSNDFLAAIAYNRIRGMNAVCVKAPGFGDRKAEFLQDVATMTGAPVLDDLSIPEGTNPNIQTMVGRARKVQVTQSYTTIIGGYGQEEKIASTKRMISEAMESAKSDYEVEKQKERLGRMNNGIGIFYVGAKTESESKEIKDRVEDAKNAIEKAIKSGCIVGAGTDFALISHKISNDKCCSQCKAGSNSDSCNPKGNCSKCETCCYGDKEIRDYVVRLSSAFLSVFCQIVENSGEKPDLFVEKLFEHFDRSEYEYGFNCLSLNIKN